VIHLSFKLRRAKDQFPKICVLAYIRDADEVHTEIMNGYCLYILENY
jgi:hypothetical protein